jgi:hypothetical protein
VPPVASELLARRPNSLINLAQRTEPAVAMMEVTRRECYRSAVRWEKKSNDFTHVGRKGREIQEMRGSFVGGRLGVLFRKLQRKSIGDRSSFEGQRVIYVFFYVEGLHVISEVDHNIDQSTCTFLAGHIDDYLSGYLESPAKVVKKCSRTRATIR